MAGINLTMEMTAPTCRLRLGHHGAHTTWSHVLTKKPDDMESEAQQLPALHWMCMFSPSADGYQSNSCGCEHCANLNPTPTPTPTPPYLPSTNINIDIRLHPAVSQRRQQHTEIIPTQVGMSVDATESIPLSTDSKFKVRLRVLAPSRGVATYLLALTPARPMAVTTPSDKNHIMVGCPLWQWRILGWSPYLCNVFELGIGAVHLQCWPRRRSLCRTRDPFQFPISPAYLL
ncbi:hypothetical protein K438DRAFT_668327 [Mycena galopus ATCC 62051]|nr:hypothetical protein K438DRAFT_668327 [Mycena galopus ATCC 62051]